jgi:hypothetical protein
VVGAVAEVRVLIGQLLEPGDLADGLAMLALIEAKVP